MDPINEGNEQLPSNKSSILSCSELQALDSWVSEMGKYQFIKNARQKMDIAKDALKLKYELIGYGFNRIVYDLNNGYVLKIALSQLGLIGNANEAYLYNNCSREIQKYLCPVKEFGVGWIIMKKMENNIPVAILEYRKLAELHFKFLRYGIVPIDLRLANVAFSEDHEMVVIDYGLFIMDLKGPVLRWFN